MRWYFIKKLVQAGATILVVATLNFILFRILPGDPVALASRDARIPIEAQMQLRHVLGLDLPWHLQYILYLENLVKGQWGLSFMYKIPVLEVVMPRLLNTMILMIPATMAPMLIGIFLGVIGGWKSHTKKDVAILGFSLVTYSLPAFWLAMVMIIVFAVYAGFFPASGMLTYGLSLEGVQYASDLLYHLALPALTLTILNLGQYALVMRGTMIDVLTEDYILTARAKGLSEGRVLRKHAFKNAMLPTVTIIAINLGYVVGGAIQTETVFGWPGLGRLMYDSILRLDYPVLQAGFLILAVFVIVANLCADLAYGWIDPRIRSGS
jgi:peptide/nickel transport system permease protein